MRSHQKQNRRPRGNKNQDDDQYTSSRTEEGSDAYSRTHSHRTSHRSDGRRTSSASTRDYYEAYRDLGSHSRGRHDEEPWYGDSSRRYRDEDIYRREDEYDGGLRREAEWGRSRSASESQYASVRDDWSQRYDHPSSSYLDSSSWGATASRGTYDGRSTYYEDWPASGARDPSFHTQDEDKHVKPTGEHDRKELGWHREHRRGKVAQQRYQSDSGWDTRRRDNGWDDRVPEEPPPVEDRTWEPASSWKSSHREGSAAQHRPQGNQRNFQSKHQYSKGGKRNQSSKHQRRDWRNDDSHLNNWTRRDLHTSNANRKGQKAQSKQKHYHSRSRSRSPAESYRSQLSSRGRSRSRSWSPAPKRRRRDHSPTVQHSPTHSDRDATNIWIPRRQTVHSRSPSPVKDLKNPHTRRKSISSVSTVTSDRSRSTSPYNKSRPVHRLPLTTGLRLDNIPQNNQHDDSRSFSPRFNGKYRSRENINESEWHSREPFSDTRYDDSMPPPPIAQASRLNYTSESTTNEPKSTPKVNISSRANRGATKNTGFKPILRPQPAPSSSLRKFFPTDDDDADQLQPESPSTGRKRSWRPLRQVSGTKAIWPPLDDDQESQEHAPSSWARESPSQLQQESTVNNQDTRMESPKQRASQRSTPRTGDVSQRRFVPPDSGNDDQRAEPPNKEADVPSMELTRPISVSHEIPPSPLPPPPPSVPPPPPEEDVRDISMHSAAPTPPKDLYSIITQVGEGTFGKVYKARNNTSNTLVALKRIRMETEKDGFPVTAMREIKLLQSLHHDNIVRLHEMMISNGSVYMVFEYMDHDLTGILSQTQFEFSPAHLKSLCHQMLAGLAYLHHKGVIHRDIKGSNILINNRGELKLADFGLARFYQKRRRTDYTNRVITLWYRPPELLFGATVYGPEVDMWSAGCIMLELFTKKPVFQGDEEIHQLDVIYKILGTPSLERWPALADLPWYQLIKPQDHIPNRFRDVFQKWMSPAALDLAERLLTYDPLRRITAFQAMETPYFTQEHPAASLPTGLATLEGEWHELESKRERAKKRRKNESGQ